MWAFLAPFKLYLIIGGVGFLLLGAFWWHTAALAKAKQEATANAKAEGYNEFRDTIYRREKAEWEERRSELEDRLVELSKRRNTVTERIITIERATDEERNKINELDINALLKDVISRAERAERNRTDNTGAITKD